MIFVPRSRLEEKEKNKINNILLYYTYFKTQQTTLKHYNFLPIYERTNLTNKKKLKAALNFYFIFYLMSNFKPKFKKKNL